MPRYRGITLSIVSQWEMKQFPEFPQPDSSRLRPSPAEDGFESQQLTSTLGSSYKASSIQGWAPSVSCYIPSIPGVRFFLKYNIEPPHPEGQLFYFKLLMNGRHISSWGVNPRTNPRGQVLRALFEAGDGHDVVDNGRTILRNGGIESRPFIFAPEMDGKSAADDGGLIEIRVFRANGRKRKAPNLEQFRPQEKYGINLPSAGLLDKPQDARFYDWILVDPKDEPYAAFKFHYRSWENLQSLQIIPPSHPRSLLKPSNSFAFLAEPEKVDTIHNEEGNGLSCDSKSDSPMFYDESLDEPSPCSIATPKLLKTSYLQQTGNGDFSIGGRKEEFLSSSLSLEEQNDQIEGRASAFLVPQEILDEWAYERPLPKLPKAKSSFDHSRKSSTCSNTPSITPSLLPWFDRDSNNLSPEPIVGVAAVVPVLRSSPVSDASALSIRRDSSSASGYNETLSPPSAPPKIRNLLDLPHEATFLPTKGVTQGPGLEKPVKGLSRNRLTISNSDTGDSGLYDRYGRDCFSPSEAEWLSSDPTVSPVKKDLKQIVNTSRILGSRRKGENKQFGGEDMASNEKNLDGKPKSNSVIVLSKADKVTCDANNWI